MRAADTDNRLLARFRLPQNLDNLLLGKGMGLHQNILSLRPFSPIMWSSFMRASMKVATAFLQSIKLCGYPVIGLLRSFHQQRCHFHCLAISCILQPAF